MKKVPKVPLKVGQRVEVLMAAANGATGTITQNLGIFGAGRKQLWRVKFDNSERDLPEEVLRVVEDK